MNLLGKLLLSLGCALFVLAVGWWYLFFEQFFGEDVKEASSCFYATSNICALGEVASVISDVPVYSPWVLWLSAGAIILGIVVLGFSPRKSPAKAPSPQDS